MNDNLKNHWGSRLRNYLKDKHNLKQLALANAIGVEESTISRWLSGGNIKVSHLINLCAFLDISIDWLIMGRGTPALHKTDIQDVNMLNGLPKEIREDIQSLIHKLSEK
ncbi:helix-turn-helix domain-containing protein [Alteromonas sp. a30]|uniref:helix-turn-helix domain-containing protein n=1 Tax=Alteromonas sp. a30 TaxID=2730917 RepID=UPI00227F602A|nr:helix-turn-helix transcriptional regulator [Alteromonas sp. a30]MCY7293832.1 helix-turn-helix transcriptional regulator [Alteromonas sp. a30]